MKKTFLALATCALLDVSSASASPIMWVHDSDGTLGTVDVATGVATPIGQMAQVMTDIAFDPSGNLFGLTFGQLFSINSTTAAITLIGNHGIAGGNALVFGADGTLYGAGNSSTNLFTINPGTGASAVVGNMGFASGGDLAFNGGNFYLASGSSQLVRVNPVTGAGVLVGNFGVNNVFGLATGDDGLLYAVAGTNVYTVNTATGAATNPVNYAGTSLGDAFGQSFFTESGAAAVPEPGTWALFGSGLVIAAWRHRQGRRRARS